MNNEYIWIIAVLIVVFLLYIFIFRNKKDGFREPNWETGDPTPSNQDNGSREERRAELRGKVIGVLRTETTPGVIVPVEEKSILATFATHGVDETKAVLDDLVNEGVAAVRVSKTDPTEKWYTVAENKRRLNLMRR